MRDPLRNFPPISPFQPFTTLSRVLRSTVKATLLAVSTSRATVVVAECCGLPSIAWPISDARPSSLPLLARPQNGASDASVVTATLASLRALSLALMRVLPARMLCLNR